MTAMPMKTYWKTAVERRRLYLDYDCWLEPTETLSGFQVTVAPYTDTAPIVVATSYPDAGHRKLMMFVSGGVGNTSYVLSMVVTTDAGQVKQDNIGLKVTP